jgi:hypothetical protein
MARIMRGIMDGLNMRKADKTDDEKTAEHRQKRLDCAGRFNRYRLRGGVVLDRHGEPSRSMHTQSQNGTGSVCNGHADPQSTSVTTGKHTKKEEPPKHFRKTAQIPDTPPAWTLSQWQVSWLTGRNLKTPSRSVCFLASISYRCARPVALCFQALRSQLRGQPRMRTSPYRVPFSSRRKTRQGTITSLLSGAARFESMADVSSGQSVPVHVRAIVPSDMKMGKSNQSFN